MGKTVIQKSAAFDLGRLRKDLAGCGWVFGQPKLKGIHLLWDGGRLLLAGGDECTGLPHINEAMAKCLPAEEFEGEAYIHGVEDEVVSGMARRSADNLHPDHEKVEFHLFDVVSPDDQKDRITHLESFVHDIDSPLFIVRSDRVRSEQEVYRNLSWWLAQGCEGIILRHPLGRWKTGYSSALQKCKPGGEDLYRIVQPIYYGKALRELMVEGTGGSRFQVRVSPELDQPGLEGKFARVRYTQFVNGKPLASAAVEIVEAGEGEAAA